MKSETKLKKIMSIEDECKRFNALDTFCLSVIPQSPIQLKAIEEIKRLQSLGYKRICEDGRIYIRKD